MQKRDLIFDIERILTAEGGTEADIRILQHRLADEHPVDIAAALQHLDEEQKLSVLEALEPETQAQVLDETDIETKKVFLEQADREVLTSIVEEMPPDEGADLLDLMPEETEQQVLQAVEEPHAGSLRELLEYEPDTAGGQMTTDFVSLKAETTAAEAIRKIQGAVDAEQVNWLYVVDDRGGLVGTVSIQQLITAKPDSMVSDFLHTEVYSVTTDVDQEEAARVVDRYNLPALPVTDADGMLKGIITLDDMVDVMREEADEDMYRMAGTASDHPMTEAIHKRVLKRLPWLLGAIVIELAVALVYSAYTETLEAMVAIVFFTPLILSLCGSLGVQSSTILVRGLATGEVEPRRISRILVHEIAIGVLIGVICGGLVGVLAGFWQQPHLGVAVGVAIPISTIFASLIGIVIPAMSHRLGIDPAITAGPLVTSITDIVPLTIYLSIATLVLQWGA